MATSKSNQGCKSAAAKPKAVKSRKAVSTSKKESESKALTPFEEMDVLFDRLSRGLMSRMGFPALGSMGWPLQAHAPKVDVIDREGEILVRAEVPGVTKDDLQVSLTDQTVTIRGETHKETKEEDGDYFRREITTGSFQRTVSLPGEIRADQAKASFRDGVLELVIPKTAKPDAKKVRID